MSRKRRRRGKLVGVPTIPEAGDGTDEEEVTRTDPPAAERTANDLPQPHAAPSSTAADVPFDLWGRDTARVFEEKVGEQEPGQPFPSDTSRLAGRAARVGLDDDGYTTHFVDFDPAELGLVRPAARAEERGEGSASSPTERFTWDQDRPSGLLAADTLPPLEDDFPRGGSTDPEEAPTDLTMLRTPQEDQPQPPGAEEISAADAIEREAHASGDSWHVSFDDAESEPLGGARVEETEEDPVERWRAHVAALELEAISARDSRRIDLLLEIGETWRDRLEDQGEAIQAFERALTLDPACGEAFTALEQLFERTASTDRLIDLLLDRSERAERWEQYEMLRRVAALYEELGDQQKALVVLEAAHALYPDDEGTVAEMCRLGGGDKVLTSTDESAKDPLELLQAQLQQTQAVDERVEILEQLATLWQRRGDVPQAIDSLEQILEADPRRESIFGRLERLYEQQGDNRALAATLERHLAVAPSQRRLELCRRLGQLHEGPLSDVAAARRAYQAGREIDPADRALITAVVRLGEKAGDWLVVADALEDLARLETRRREKADILLKLGDIRLERLADSDAAERCFLDAVAAKPSHEPAVEALLDVYRRRADWGKVVKTLVDAEMDADNPGLKTRLRYEAGVVVLHHLHDEEQAVKLFERTLALDPDHGAAAGFLSDLYFKDKRFADLEPVLELLLRKAPREDTKVYARLVYRMGRTAEALGKRQRAKRFYLEALDIDPDDLKSLRQLAGIALAESDWTEAMQHYQRLLVELKTRTLGESEFPENEVIVVFGRLAEAARNRGDVATALRAMEQLLEIRPRDRDCLERYAALQAEQRDWGGLIETRRRVLELTTDASDRARAEREIGDAWLHAGRPDEAARAFWRALEPRPESRTVLHKLLDLYSDAEQWPQTVDLCERLAATEEDPPRRAKYFYTAGVICRDRLADAERAVSFFNKSLDDDPEQLKAFEAIDELCTSRRDWKRLEHCYGRMIQRLPAEGRNELKATLWHNLGEVLRSRRRDFETAVAAFEAAQRLDPGNDQRLEIIAELYGSLGPAEGRKAITAFHQLVSKQPHRVELYRTLGQLYMADRQFDPAWCLCAVLSFLRQADGDERAFYRQHAALRRATARINDELWWRRIAHPDQDRYISAIFALLSPIVASMTARSHAEFNMRRKNRRDLASDDHRVSRFFSYVTSLLNVAEADLHHRPDVDTDLVMAHTIEAPSFVAGARLLAVSSEKEMAFSIAKQLAFLRPDNFVRNAFPARAQLQLVLLAAIKMCDPNFPLPLGQDAGVDKMLAQIRRRLRPTPAIIEQLGPLVRRINPEDLDLSKWWRGCELTAERIGLIVCTDPYVSAQRISIDCGGSDALARERIAEMVCFAASEEYFAVRQELGLAIG